MATALVMLGGMLLVASIVVLADWIARRRDRQKTRHTP